MKILTVVFGLGLGGTQRAAQNFCEGYAALDHDSRIIAVSEGGARVEELKRAGIQVWLGTGAEVVREITLWHPEVIHLHSIGLTEDVVLILKEACPGARFVETNIFSNLSPYTHHLDYSYQLSKWCAYNYISRGGIRSKCIVIPNPVKTENFSRVSHQHRMRFRKKHSIPEHIFLFGRVGQALFDKWSFYLIDIFKKFCDSMSDSCLLLVVKPPEQILDYARRCGVFNKMVIVNEINGDEALSCCYSSIDTFLHIANQGESFGLVLAESLLCETPVITLNTPWSDNSQEEVVGNGRGGYCVNTLEHFLFYMSKLYQDPELCRQMGREGRLSILKRYEYRQIASMSVDLLTGFDTKKFSLSRVKSFGSGTIKYSLPVKILLLTKLNFFGRNAHTSVYHRGINWFIRLFSRYKKRR